MDQLKIATSFKVTTLSLKIHYFCLDDCLIHVEMFQTIFFQFLNMAYMEK